MYDDIYYIYIHTYIHVLYQRYSSIYIYMYDVYICEKYIAPCRLDEIRVIPVWPLLICFQSDNLYVLLLWFSNFVVMGLLSTKHVCLSQLRECLELYMNMTDTHHTQSYYLLYDSRCIVPMDSLPVDCFKCAWHMPKACAVVPEGLRRRPLCKPPLGYAVPAHTGPWVWAWPMAWAGPISWA